MGNTSSQNFQLIKRLVEQEGGERGWQAVWQQLTEAEQRGFHQAVRGGWGGYPLFFKLLELGAGLTGADPSGYARQFGAYQVQHDIPLLVQSAIKFGGPGLLVMEAGHLWRRYHDTGRLEVYEMLPDSAWARLQDVDGGGPLLCALLQGFATRGVELSGQKHVSAEHPICIYRGGNQCLFHVHWDPRKP